MTIPSRIAQHKNGKRVEYIRADIVEELARALEEIAVMDIMSCSAIAYSSLRAYHEACK